MTSGPVSQLAFTLVTLAEDAPNPAAHTMKYHAFDSTWFSNHHLMSVASAAVALAVLALAACKMKPRPEHGAEGHVTRGAFPNLIETLLVYLRDQTVRPLLKGATDRYIGFLWSAFFFILVGNIFGLIPTGAAISLLTRNAHHGHWLGGTFTGNLSFTAGLAGVAALMFLFSGVRENGIKYFAHFWVVPLKGQPVYLWPLLALVGLVILVLEVVGTFLIKPFALCVRLFANMVAGHLVLGSILAMAMVAAKASNWLGAGASFLGAVALSFMELFVAFLQAYIFVFLSAIFISLGAAHHDDHGHEGDEAHAH